MSSFAANYLTKSFYPLENVLEAIPIESQKRKRWLCAACRHCFINREGFTLQWNNVEALLPRSGTNCPICTFLAKVLIYLAGRSETAYGRQRLRLAGQLSLVEAAPGKRECPQLRVTVDEKIVFNCHLLSDIRGTIFQPGSIPLYLRDRQFHDDGSILHPSSLRSFIMKCCLAFGDGPHSVKDGCGRRQPDPNPLSINLIDVNDLCIVTTDSSVGYCALSYVWGKRKILTSTKQNREELQRPGSLSRSGTLATVIRDAIQLVQAMGEKYLWVDSLCITQDDGVHSAFYINKMDYIYSQSLFTIIASASTTAHDSLHGVIPGSRPPHHSFKAEGIRAVRPPTNLIDHLASSVYETRAWTFQERLLSKRSIILTETEAFLSCPSMVVSESQGTVPREYRRFHPLRRFFQPSTTYGETEEARFRSLLCYRDLVVAYTRRQLSYDSDILRAFGGISAFLEAKMLSGCMILGLPTHDLALALTWVSVGPTARRPVCTAVKTPDTLILPSWAWAGWTGEKAWSPPFGYFDAIKDTQARRQYHPLVRDFKLKSNTDTHWQAVGLISSSLHPSMLPAHILKFEASVVATTQLRVEAETSGRYVLIQDLDGAYFRGDCLTLEISYNTRRSVVSKGGLVFGVDQRSMADPDCALIALIKWKRKPGPAFSYVYRRDDYPFYEDRHEPYTTTSEDYDDDWDREAYFYSCLVVRWADRGRSLCERIGVALISADLWHLRIIEKTEEGIILT